MSAAEFPSDPEIASHWAQWLGHPRPQLLIVGQDFSDAGYFERHRSADDQAYPTNKNLYRLLTVADFSPTAPGVADLMKPVYSPSPRACAGVDGLDGFASTMGEDTAVSKTVGPTNVLKESRDMSTTIAVPVLRARERSATPDTGGAATVGKRTRRALSEEVASLAIEQEALDQVIQSATDILSRAMVSESKAKNIRVNSLSFHIGVTAGGSVGILGTGLDIEAEASFEISFHVVDV